MAAERVRRSIVAAIGLACASRVFATVPFAGPDTPSVAKPARNARREATSRTLTWHDGAVRRSASIDASLEADFSPRAGKDVHVLRPAGSAPISAAPLVSPVLRDESGRLRALPGGVLVVLAAPLDEAAARALIARAGAVPSRALSPLVWVVEGPVGLGSLELANRLHATALFAAAQPNWWVQRTLK